jgi:hypothetical protein
LCCEVFRGLGDGFIKGCFATDEYDVFSCSYTKRFEMDDESRIINFFIGTLIKEIYIALGVVGTNYWTISFFEFTIPH